MELGQDGHRALDRQRRPQLPRKERERLRHRDEVLQAAETLLERRSYRDLTVQEIAEEAEFSVGYLYKLFGSKEDIFATLIKQKSRMLRDLFDRHLLSNLPTRERLLGLVRALMAWLNENTAFATTYVRELRTLALSNEELAHAKEENEEHALKRLHAFFQEAIDRGELGSGEPPVMAKTLWSLMWGFIEEDLIRGERRDWTDYADPIVGIVTRAFPPES